MAAVLHNKWLHGKARFDFSKVDSRMLMREGIVPVQAVLDAGSGSEMVLLLIDHSPFMDELAQVKPFNLFLKTGIAKTDHGTVMFLLFWIPDPRDPDVPFMTIDAHANPHDPVHMVWWRDLSRQSHWHLFLVDSRNEQRGFFEFENNFRLGEALDTAEKACAGMLHGDFNLAKKQFSEQHSLDDLMAM